MAKEAASKKTEVKVLSGIAYYAFLHKPKKANADYDIPPMYVLSLIPDKESLEILEKYGLKTTTRSTNIPEPYIDIKTKILEDSHVVERKPKLVDSKLRAIPESVLVGNGSKVLVKTGFRWVKQQKKWTPDLYGVQVVDLVAYSGGSNGDDFKPLDKGYSAPTSDAGKDEEVAF